MRRFFFMFLFAISAPAFAAEAPVQKEPVTAGEKGMTIADCLGILGGVNALDGGTRVIIGAGKPTESAETIRFKLPAKVRDAMSHDLFVLGQVQQEAQAANRRIQIEIMGTSSEPIKPGSKENMTLDARLTEYTARPCTVALDHIRDADLDLEHNDISASILSLLTKIRDK